VLELLVLPFCFRRTRKLAKPKLMLLLLVPLGGATGVLTVVGCGSNTGYFAQKQQSYTVTITATSGTVSHSTNVVVVVQ
jgi:hypothetical protein